MYMKKIIFDFSLYLFFFGVNLWMKNIYFFIKNIDLEFFLGLKGLGTSN